MNGGQLLASVGGQVVSNAWTIVGTGDFNGDGKSDILWRNTNGTVAIWEMNGGQLLASVGGQVVTNAWTIVGTGDFNGDGKSDILWRNTNGTVAIWEMNGGQLLASVGGQVVSQRLDHRRHRRLQRRRQVRHPLAQYERNRGDLGDERRADLTHQRLSEKYPPSGRSKPPTSTEEATQAAFELSSLLEYDQCRLLSER